MPSRAAARLVSTLAGGPPRSGGSDRTRLIGPGNSSAVASETLSADAAESLVGARVGRIHPRCARRAPSRAVVQTGRGWTFVGAVAADGWSAAADLAGEHAEAAPLDQVLQARLGFIACGRSEQSVCFEVGGEREARKSDVMEIQRRFRCCGGVCLAPAATVAAAKREHRIRSARRAGRTPSTQQYAFPPVCGSGVDQSDAELAADQGELLGGV